MREATFILATAISVALSNIASGRITALVNEICKQACSTFQIKIIYSFTSLSLFVTTFILIFVILLKIMPQKFENKNE